MGCGYLLRPEGVVRFMYAHVDCNNFFVSCERLFRPGLENKPVAVLSNNDSCLISRSAEVKALGIPMAAPLFEVQDLVNLHNITLFSANFELYGDISQRIVEVLRSITPLIEVYSIDECFLDLTKLHITDLSTWAKNVRYRIKKEIGVPVSIGVGITKTLAKTATGYAKKHGGVSVVEDDESRKIVLEQLSVGDVWGIGWRTAPKLKERGVVNAWRLVGADDGWLKQYFNIGGMRMVNELRGLRCLDFGDKHDKRKSILVSRAFGHKVRDYHQLESATASFATKAASKLRAQGSVCSNIGLYIMSHRLDGGSGRVFRSLKLAESTDDTGRIIVSALSLLSDLYDSDLSYRKVAVLLTEIVDVEAWQLSLTDPVVERDDKSRLMKNIDKLNHRYGLGTVWHAVEDKTGASWQSRHQKKSRRYTTRWGELPVVKV